MSPKKKDEELEVSEEEEEEVESKQDKDDDKDDVDDIDNDVDDDVVESKNDDDDESPNPVTSRNKMDSSDLPLNSAKSARKVSLSLICTKLLSQTTKNHKADDDFVETPKSKVC